MKTVRLLAVILLLTATTTPSTATTNDTPNIVTPEESSGNGANEPPLADAGLDQTVARGSTVYLDAGESRDPDGSIVDFRWTITRPSGSSADITPVCQRCEQTRFRPEATGTYRVTLEVTDDDGASRTDFLLVEVRAGEPPSVTLASHSRTTTGDATRFTADVTAGAAPLRQLVWRVDGEPVATDSLSRSSTTSTHVARFPTPGTHTVSVVAIDEDDQQDTATRTVSVTAPSPTGDSGEQTADVTGPRVVTGHGRLRADYSLTGNTFGTWMLDGARVDDGPTTSLELSPGVHQMYADTPDGVATFEDGTRTVVADPAPELTVGNLTDTSIVPVDIHATDEFGNLQSVTVDVDGEPVETFTVDQVGGRRAGRSFSTVEHLNSLEPGSHAITVRARDARGQTAVAIRTVTVPGPPEVVSAGFVRDGPLDQYHPRLNESRYTATYRVKVKLNGVDPEAAQAWIKMPDSFRASSVTQFQTESGKYLVLERESYRDRLGTIIGQSHLSWRQNHSLNYSTDQIEVTPAPPEIRVSPFQYKRRLVSGKGIGLDASDSFDPDGTKLRYLWRNAQNEDVRKPSIFLHTFDYTYLQIDDGNHQVSVSDNLLSWLIPRVSRASYNDGGPFYPNETVTYTVWSERFLLTKPSYEELLSYALRADAGVVTNSSMKQSQPSSEKVHTKYFPRWHQWVVEVPASEFVGGEPTVTSYGTKHPKVQHELTLPRPDLYVPAGGTLQNVSVDAQYLVKRPAYVERQTASEKVRDSLLADGYTVQRISNAGHEYELEEYVQTSDPVYDIDTMQFDRDGRRQYYLSLNPEWERAGTTRETRTWTTTEDVWRSYVGGSGTYTGETRNELVEPGVYRTEKQYEYQATETYQTTIQYQDTYTITETEISYERRCTMFGCRMYQTTSTETDHYTVTRTETVTRTRTVERQYWSTRPRNPSHHYTGRVRRVTVSEPEYERQYRFRVQRQHSETNRVYLAERRTLVEPASYSWEVTSAVSNRIRAKTAAMSPDVRVGDIVPTRQWTLEKRGGSKRVYVSSVDQRANVLETHGSGEGTLVQKYVRDGTAELTRPHTRTLDVSAEYTGSGFVPDRKIKDTLERKMEEKGDA